MTIAYLTSKYPAPSHTFIRREIEALRSAGLNIEPFSIRPPDAEEFRVLDGSVCTETFYVLPHWRNGIEQVLGQLSILAKFGVAGFRRPLKFWQTFRLALRHRVPGCRGLLWTIFYFIESMVLANELERRSIAHLHNHFANPAANVGMLAANYLGLTWSLTLHGISEFDYPAGVMLPDKLKRAKFVACATYFGRAQAQRLVDPKHWEKMIVVRCGVEVNCLPHLKTSSFSESEQNRRLRIVCVARLSPEKGIAGLLDAFSTVVDEGIDAELILVGSGPDRSALEQRVDSLALEPRVRLLGRVPEAEALKHLASADLCVLASFMEGLPVVLMEALALRIPVVAPHVAGIPELIRHKQQGLLFSPSDWSDLAECLRTMLTDSQLRRSCGDAGRKRIDEEFDIQLAVQPLAKKFAEFLPN